MMDENSNLLTWVMGGVVAMLSSLAGTVGFLFKLNESKNKKSIERLQKQADKCENDRTELRARVVRLEAYCEINNENSGSH